MYPLSYNGYLLNELRISNIVYYATNLKHYTFSFTTDLNTVGLYYFDEELPYYIKNLIYLLEPSNGIVKYGGLGTSGFIWALKSMLTALNHSCQNLNYSIYPNPFHELCLYSPIIIYEALAKN